MLEILIDKTERSELVTSPLPFQKGELLITINYRKGGAYHSPLATDVGNPCLKNAKPSLLRVNEIFHCYRK